MSALAFAIGFVRSGGSVLYLANTKRECDEAFRSLQPHLSEKVAIRTTDHDEQKLEDEGPKYVAEIEAGDDGYTPAAFFNRSELGNYPALIGTHNGYKQHPSELLTLATGKRRALILVDECPDNIDVADFKLADFENIHELCRRRGLDELGDEPKLTMAFGEAWRQLTLAHAHLDLDRTRPFRELSIKLEPQLIEALTRFAESPRNRARLAAGTSYEPEALRLAARLVILAQETKGFAFAALNTEFTHGARLVAYAPSWPLRPGTVLLDATSDIDGYAELSSARVQELVPEADYRNLEPIHLDGPNYVTGWSPKELWKKPETRRPLLKWMHRCILENTHQGEAVLVVSWKDVIQGDQLQPLDWEGRHLRYCHFGAGIGSNRWRDCSAVFIFGNYVKPTRTTVAETHGIKGIPYRENGDATIRGLKGDYRTVKDGLTLRWFKQLAMRGCARELDENGVAKPMRLYFSHTEFGLMAGHWERMFPGSPKPKTIVIGDDEAQTDQARSSRHNSRGEAILRYLSSTEKDEVSSSDIREATGSA